MTAQAVRNWTLVVVACALVVAGRGIPALAHASSDGERTVILTALGKDGEPIRDLKAEDFTIAEDGAVREVASAAVATAPMFIDVLVDTSKPALGAADPIHDLRTGLADFVKIVQGASPESQIALGEFAGVSIQTVNFTTKTADLTKVIARLSTSQRSSSVLLEALLDAAKDISKKPSTRRVIVTVNFDTPEASAVDGNSVVSAVKRSGASYWPISVGTSGGAPGRDMIVEMLPAVTGGMLVTAVSANTVDNKLKALADALTSQYMLTYRNSSGAQLTSIQAGAKGAAKVVVSLPAPPVAK
jgi:hypothetical protein